MFIFSLMDALVFQSAPSVPSLLSVKDPPPFEVINPNGKAEVLLICDHASRTIPQSLGDLGLNDEQRGFHIAYDIGAAAVTRNLSAALDAPAVLCGYSRLVIDCNRSPGNPESVLEVSDDNPIPGNVDLSATDVLQRQAEIFWPYHTTISTAVTQMWRRNGRPPALFSVHSFTPHWNGQQRPWDIGVLWHHDQRISAPLMLDMAERHGLQVGDNLPYSGIEAAYSIDVHGDAAGIANVVIEIRQDQISDAAGIELWSDRLIESLPPIFANDDLHRILRH